MTINDRLISVQAGDGILTLPGNWHGLKQTGTEDLVVIIIITKRNRQPALLEENQLFQPLRSVKAAPSP